MKLFQFLQSTLQSEWKRVLLIAAAGGVANTLIFGTLNAGATAALKGSQTTTYILMFAISTMAFYVAKRYAITEGSRSAEKVLADTLSRITDKIRRSELPVVERLAQHGSYQSIAQDTTTISQATMLLIAAAQQSVMVVASLMYVAIISPLNFIVTIGVILVGTILYYMHSRYLAREIVAQKGAESRMLMTLEDVVDGFKELRLNRRKSESVQNHIKDITTSLYRARVATNNHYCTDLLFADMFFYLLLAIVILILPSYQKTTANQVMVSASSILFIIIPLQAIVASGTVIMRASVAIDHLEDLEKALDREVAVCDMATEDEKAEPIDEIFLDNIEFRYPSTLSSDGTLNDTFQIGPFSLKINRGETVFLVGGNGCGKTTLLKVLTGLYQPTGGQLLVNGSTVTRDNVESYRNSISAIFSDFHLFQRLYGYEDADPARVNTLLAQLKISDKTAFVDGEFTTIKLSTGQRKRVALVAALLEERDIIVFDEWAADQDPHFRAYFYEVLLADLKAQGKTIIAITHDERYWHLADRVVRLEYGSLVDSEDADRALVVA